MTKIIFKNKFLVIVVLCFTLALSCSNAFAWGHGGGHGGHGGYHWDRGRWWGPGWFGFDVAVTALAIGAMVDTLPYGYTTVEVGRVPYYYYDNTYFRPYPAGGYIVVQEPVSVYQPVQYPTVVQSSAPVVAQPAAYSNVVSSDKDEEFTVNIPNARNGYTPVTLKRSGNGFIGPQGEFYTEFPKIRLLKAMYGK